MTAKKTKPAAKPKKLSKTKQELRRLREFVRQFTHDSQGRELRAEKGDGIEIGGPERIAITGKAFTRLRDHAEYALTGKKTVDLANRAAVAADVARLNAMSKAKLTEFLAGKSEPPDYLVHSSAERARLNIPDDRRTGRTTKQLRDCVTMARAGRSVLFVTPGGTSAFARACAIPTLIDVVLAGSRDWRLNSSLMEVSFDSGGKVRIAPSAADMANRDVRR